MLQAKRISVKRSNEFHELFRVDSSTVLNDSINLTPRTKITKKLNFLYLTCNHRCIYAQDAQS